MEAAVVMMMRVEMIERGNKYWYVLLVVVRESRAARFEARSCINARKMVLRGPA